MGNGQQIRDFCFVADVVDALLRIGQLAATSCEAFNVSSGTSYSVLQIAENMCDIMGLHSVEFSFTGQSWAGDSQRWEASIHKLQSRTGYLSQYDLTAGLTTFVKWFDDHPEMLRS
jgi:nucleoside-diphosphate-sugar epimerase